MPKSWQVLKEALAHSISNNCCSAHCLRCHHARVISSGLCHNLYISNILITEYFFFRDPQSARLVFDSQCKRPTKSLIWNSLIKGYLRSGSPRLALNVYQEMAGPLSQCEPCKQTFHLAITACAHLSEFELGYGVGEHARRKGLESNLLVATALVDLYSKAGDLETARRLFDGMLCRDVVSWNAMISGYSQAGSIGDVMDLFKDMRFIHGILPTEATLVSVISGCGDLSLKAIHAHAIKIGFEANQVVSNSLIAMYIDCDFLDAAAELFNRMVLKDAISWSTMIGGYVQRERPRDALEIFHLMIVNTKILPTRPILLNVLLACADLGYWQEGRWVEEKYLIGDGRRFELDASLITVLIYMYAKSGKMEISMKHLDEDMRLKWDVIAWNAMIKACAELGQVDVVLEITFEMQRRGINPDQVTFLTVLPLISSIPFPRKGMEIHGQIIKGGFESERTIANSLIDMYAKSGSIGDSRKVYNGIREKDVVSWSSIIKACACNGNAEEALNLFQLMRGTETNPNRFTFLAILSACRHAGFVEKGWELFESMKHEFGLKPGIEHFTCMVDILCRAGLLSDALHLLQDGMPEARTSAVLWGSLLNACRLHHDPVIGEAAAMHLFILEPRNAANYLMLADIYISAGRREDANVVLRLLRSKGLEKRPGCSWFEEGRSGSNWACPAREPGEIVGYCAEGAHRILVYEFVDNGNVEQWLHGDVGPVSPLTCEIRMNIILGTAKGYVAHEYTSTGMLNERSDVYSFGILIMEIVSGRSPVDYNQPPAEVNLVGWLKTMVSNQNSKGVLDPKMPENPTLRLRKEEV